MQPRVLSGLNCAGRAPIQTLALLLISCAAMPQLRAHNPDTSYTRITISPSEIEFRFTFDVATLLKIIDLDENHDRQVDAGELSRNAPMIYEFLRRQIRLTFVSTPTDFGDPKPAEFSAGETAAAERDYQQVFAYFTFRKSLAKMPEQFTLVFDIFDALGERHINLASIEDGNQRIDEIVFSKLEPDYIYVTNAPPPLWTQLAQFLSLGVKHIFLGYDHILFLLALIVVSRFWELVKIVTSFTVAHTITLILAALEIVRLPPRLIETGIAVTIMYVALENLWIKKSEHRWMLTFAFGLIHGFGFANVLRDLGLPTQGLVRSLLSFNVGVELGQVAIVLLLLPLSLWLGRWRFGDRAAAALSLLIFSFGLAWFLERAFALRFMPI